MPNRKVEIPFRKFGIELEVNGSTSDDDIIAALGEHFINCESVDYEFKDYPTSGDCWFLKEDASIGIGTEMVSGILSWNPWCIRRIKTVCDVLTDLGFDSSGKCGLHVHMDATDLTEEQCVLVAELYGILEPILFRRYFKRHRRRNKECTSIGKFIKDPSLKENPEALWEATKRYATVIRTKHGTLEFRQHHGTLRAGEILNWIELLQYVVWNALHTPKPWYHEMRPSKRRHTVVDTEATIARMLEAFKEHDELEKVMPLVDQSPSVGRVVLNALRNGIWKDGCLHVVVGKFHYHALLKLIRLVTNVDMSPDRADTVWGDAMLHFSKEWSEVLHDMLKMTVTQIEITKRKLMLDPKPTDYLRVLPAKFEQIFDNRKTAYAYNY